MAGPGGDDEGLDVELWKRCGGYGVVTDDGDVGAEEAELLVEIPSEGVEVVDQQAVDGFGEHRGERHARHRRCRRRDERVISGSSETPSTSVTGD